AGRQPTQQQRRENLLNVLLSASEFELQEHPRYDKEKPESQSDDDVAPPKFRPRFRCVGVWGLHAAPHIGSDLRRHPPEDTTESSRGRVQAAEYAFGRFAPTPGFRRVRVP